MKNTKTMQVVMLPTEKASKIGEKDGKLYFFNGSNEDKYPSGNYSNKHLYIVSDAEIKEGDWEIAQGRVRKYCGGNSTKGKKIEATTDSSLFTGEAPFGVKISQWIPQIPQSFIEAYCKTEGKIKEVAVELYEHGYSDREEIKTREDNTVIIHQSKTYSKEEVSELIHKYRDDRFSYKKDHGKVPVKFTEEWLYKNL